MNKDRRKAISDLVERLSDLQMKVEELSQEVEAICEEEQGYFDNMPESLQSGEKGQAAEEAVRQLEDAKDTLESVDFGEAIQALESAAA